MSTHWSRPRRLVAVLVGLSIVTAACSIPTDEEARPVDDVPDDLFATTTAVPDTVVDDEQSEFNLPLFFYNDEDGLVRVDRPRDEAPTVQEALVALTASPTPEEVEETPGIATRFLPGMQPEASLDSESRLLTVMVQGPELREAVETAPERVQRIYTQIVCSMDALTTLIETVQINDTEGAIRVQDDDGTARDGPIGPADVNDCKTAAELAAEAVEEADAEAEAEAEGDNQGTDEGSG